MVRRIFRSRLFHAVSIYGATNALSRAVPFLLVPVFTRFLTSHDYGVLAMFGVTVSVMTMLSGFGAINTVSLRFFQKDRIDLGPYIGNCIFLLAASSALIALGVWAFGARLEALAEFPAEWFWAALFVAAAGFVTTTLLHLWQAASLPGRYALFQLLMTAGGAGLSVLFVVGLGMDWRGRVWAQVGLSAALAAASLVFLRRSGWLKWEASREHARSALRMGAPLLPHALGGLVIEGMDRVMITRMVGVEHTGVYSVGLQVGMLVLFVTGSFNMAWVPWLFARLKDSDDAVKRRIVRVTYAYGAAILGLAALLAVSAPVLFRFFVGPDFSGGAEYVRWIGLGYAFNGMYMMAVNYIFYVEKTYLVAVVTAFSALVNAIATYALIRTNGAVGAAQGFMLAHLASFVLAWFFSARAYPMPWFPARGLLQGLRGLFRSRDKAS